MLLNRIKILTAKLLSILPIAILRQVQDTFVRAINFKIDSLFTYVERPQHPSEIKSFYKDTFGAPGAIVVQGPYVKESNFTKNTLLLYRKFYPKKAIILSTWENLVASEDRRELEGAQIAVVESQHPPYSGVLNINYQVCSTLKGLDWVRRNLPTARVLKTRTDQRIYQSNLFSYFEDLKASLGSPNKIAALSFNSKRKVLGSISDMMIYGTLEQLEKYFSLAQMNVSVDIEEFFKDPTKYLNPEQHFFQHYVGHLPENDSDYVKMVVDNFLLVDREQIDLYWNKYTRLENKKIYNMPESEAFWSFAEYLRNLRK